VRLRDLLSIERLISATILRGQTLHAERGRGEGATLNQVVIAWMRQSDLSVVPIVSGSVPSSAKGESRSASRPAHRRTTLAVKI